MADSEVTGSAARRRTRDPLDQREGETSQQYANRLLEAARAGADVTRQPGDDPVSRADKTAGEILEIIGRGGVRLLRDALTSRLHVPEPTQKQMHAVALSGETFGKMVRSLDDGGERLKGMLALSRAVEQHLEEVRSVVKSLPGEDAREASKRLADATALMGLLQDELRHMKRRIGKASGRLQDAERATQAEPKVAGAPTLHVAPTRR